MNITYKVRIERKTARVIPRPDRGIHDGLVLLLNKPLRVGAEPILVCDIKRHRTSYELPVLPDGVFIVGAIVQAT